MNTTQPKQYLLIIIVFSQFACTSLWFAGNAVITDLQKEFGLSQQSLGHLTSAVQFGFITGTLVFAILTIADRFSPSKVFFFSATIGAIFNLAFASASEFYALLAVRAATGFMLAGIYPAGMKIAADYHEKGLGKALGYLVGALVLGTAFPHLLKTLTTSLPWRSVIYGTSAFAFVGGLSLFLGVKDGPFRKKSSVIKISQFLKVFQAKEFRQAAFGYFGHMWELYTFWAFVPLMISYHSHHSGIFHFESFVSFVIIAMGGIACVIGGYLSQTLGSSKVAFFALLASGICCLLSPFMLVVSFVPFMSFLLIWGMAVIADSPQFSSLVAFYAPSDSKGTALTIVNCVGFAITIVSIQLLNGILSSIELRYAFLLLAPGPILGTVSIFKLARKPIG